MAQLTAIFDAVNAMGRPEVAQALLVEQQHQQAVEGRSESLCALARAETDRLAALDEPEPPPPAFVARARDRCPASEQRGRQAR